MHSTKFIRFFDGDAEPRYELLGGKCASLVMMTAAGMPVPPGFAVTTALYDEFIARSGISAEIDRALSTLAPDDVGGVDAVSQRIRGAICSREVLGELRRGLLAAFEELQSRCGCEISVAVRSSATAEDLPGASFAGQQETYLWLVGADAVLEHIRRCWASLYTSRAIFYRLRNGISEEGLSMAVAVQKMVNARAAGVAITMNPATGDRSKITIDASYGVGELVVSGQVTPDNIVLDKVMLSVISCDLGGKHAELVPDIATGTLVEQAVDEARRHRCCLGADEIEAVAAMAKQAEQRFGCPQDVEWAIDRDLPPGRNLLLLQSRPETVHSPRAAVPEAREKLAPAAPGAFDVASLTSSLTSGLPRP